MNPRLHVTVPQTGMGGPPPEAAFDTECLAIVVTDRRRTIYGEAAETHIEDATARIYLDPEQESPDWPDPCKLFVVGETGRTPLGVFDLRSRMNAGKFIIIELRRRA